MFEKRNNKLNERVRKKFGYVNEVNIPPLPRELAMALQAGDEYNAAAELERADPRLLQSLLGIYHECDVDDPKSIDCLVYNLMKVVQAAGSRGEPHSYKPEDMGYNAGTPLVKDEPLNEEYDEGYRDRLDQVQAANPEKTMPEIEAMLSGDDGGIGIGDEEPIPNSGGEKYNVGDSIRDEDNRTGEVLELTAYGAVAQFEGEEGPEKIRFKHMTKTADNKELARPEEGDEMGFDDTGLFEYGDFNFREEDEALQSLEEEFPDAFKMVVGENEGGDCAEASIEIAVGDDNDDDDDDDITVMTQESDDDDHLYTKRDSRLHEQLIKWSTK